MKLINKYTQCFSCYGCNKLELEKFEGTNNCKNYIKVETEVDKRIRIQIQRCKDILTKGRDFKCMEGVQVNLWLKKH